MRMEWVLHFLIALCYIFRIHYTLIMNSENAIAIGLFGDLFLDFLCIHYFVADHSLQPTTLVHQIF